MMLKSFRSNLMKRKTRRTANPSGLHVVFLGTDGSGKSTICEYTLNNLAEAFAGTRYFHVRPHLGLSKSVKVPVNVSKVKDPHGRPLHNRFVSILKLAYLFYDYTAGYLVKVMPALARNKLVVFERYYHDLLVDPHRYRYCGPMWLARWIGKLIPKPDLWILLLASPDVLRARKQEVPPEEMARQRATYLGLAEKLRNSHVVDVSQPLDDVMAEVNRIILSHLAQRTGR